MYFHHNTSTNLTYLKNKKLQMGYRNVRLVYR